MLHIQAFDLVKWLHLIALAVAGGASVVALLLSGFEDTREDLRGLAATVWAKVVVWGFRAAFLLGLVLLGMKLHRGEHPFDERYLHVKILLAILLVGLSETAPKVLARAKRGAAMLVLMLFLLTTFLGVAGPNLLGLTRSRPYDDQPELTPRPTLQTR